MSHKISLKKNEVDQQQEDHAGQLKREVATRRQQVEEKSKQLIEVQQRNKELEQQMSKHMDHLRCDNARFKTYIDRLSDCATTSSGTSVKVWILDSLHSCITDTGPRVVQ